MVVSMLSLFALNALHSERQHSIPLNHLNIYIKVPLNGIDFIKVETKI
jgi:hypothetical protein